MSCIIARRDPSENYIAVIITVIIPSPRPGKYENEYILTAKEKNIRYLKKIPTNFSLYPLVKNWISWSMNFYLLASSVCISEQSWELSHWSKCAYIWRKNYAVSLSSLGTWLTLLGMWHFSRCQSEWLAREFISFFTISLSLSQFLTEFSLLSQLSLATLGAT